MSTFPRSTAPPAPVLPRAARPLRGPGRGSGPLASRAFRLFLLSQSVAGTGTWVQRTAQDWLVLELTGSVAAVGLVVTVQCLPALLLGLWGGAIADRYRPRRLMLLCNGAAAVLALVMTVLVTTGAARMWSVCVLAGALGVMTAVEGPARQALIPRMVGPEHRRSATGLASANFQLARIAGPALAGLLIGCLGTGWAFLLCTLTPALCAAVLLFLRRTPALDRAPVPHAADPAQRRGALGIVAAHPRLRWTLVLSGLMALFGLNLPVLLPALATDGFGAAPESFGVLSALLAVGSLLGALLAARLRTCPLRTLAACALAVGALQVGAACAPSMAAFGALLVPVGIAALCFTTTAATAVQMGAAPALQGRVAGLAMLVTLGSAAVGAPLTGAIAEAIGARSAFVLTGASCAGIAALAVVAVIRTRPAAAAAAERARPRRTVTVTRRPATAEA
ncbi:MULTISPECIES: MFS transporter [unclassified Streptomyces]|uniref:MFS transporter n=1 Tax=unclassified Streptomyces TaxID=2593676 RepID=UPI00068A1265|nr:MFS transporter [Streptomyces sp. NRRL F-2747]